MTSPPIESSFSAVAVADAHAALCKTGAAAAAVAGGNAPEAGPSEASAAEAPPLANGRASEIQQPDPEPKPDPDPDPEDQVDDEVEAELAAAVRHDVRLIPLIRTRVSVTRRAAPLALLDDASL